MEYSLSMVLRLTMQIRESEERSTSGRKNQKKFTKKYLRNGVFQVVYKELYDLLVTSTYPVREQGSLSGTLPETIITTLLIDSPNNCHADNIPRSTTYQVQIALYSRKPSIKQSADELFKSILIPANWLRVNGRDLPYDKETGYYGFKSDYNFYESEVIL